MIQMKRDMMHRARYLVLVFLLCLGVARAADEPIYDEKADASQQIAVGITAASQSGNAAKSIVLVFGEIGRAHV